jgi:hypothetical protein
MNSEYATMRGEVDEEKKLGAPVSFGAELSTLSAAP